MTARHLLRSGPALAALCLLLAPLPGHARSPDAALEDGLSAVIKAIEGDKPEVALQRVDALVALRTE